MKNLVLQFLAVALGGALGAVLRFAIAGIFSWSLFPIGTFIINITGSLFLGWFLTLASERLPIPHEFWRVGIATGFVGAYTTFSTYMFESDKMLQDAWGIRATLYLVGSVVLGLIAVRAGILLARLPHNPSLKMIVWTLCGVTLLLVLLRLGILLTRRSS